MMRYHEDTVMLRSTTGSYGRPVIEVAYGETMISLHRGCLGDISSGRVLGCRHDASPMFDIPGSTPVWAQYLLFFYFQRYKNLYVLCFQIYTYYKKNTGGL